MNAQMFLNFWMEEITNTNLISNDYFENTIIKQPTMVLLFLLFTNTMHTHYRTTFFTLYFFFSYVNMYMIFRKK